VRLLRGTLAIAALTVLAAPRIDAQAGHPVVTLRTIPAVPVRGTVALVVVRSTDSAARVITVEGEAAGEPLHFEPAGHSYRSIAGIPLEGADSLEITLRMARRLGTDTLHFTIPIRTPVYPDERLTVAPKYAQLDSATQARVDGEVEEARAVGRSAHDVPRLWSGRFAAPRPGRVRSVFGTGRVFNGEVTSRHYGTDFAGKIGAPVRAAGRGVVALVADFYLAGHAIYLSHGGGLVTGYFHLSRVDVTAGDTVTRGQVIGGVGRSGRATGPHLHWIARYGAITVDPMSLLRLPP
jgi:murein DD-endopeptidase MepM/ murein hydrolase activator NlpD